MMYETELMDVLRRLIAQTVEAEVARVLPLHQSPQAAVEADPEPRDVGHPVCSCQADGAYEGLPKYEDAKHHPVGLTWDDKLWGPVGQPPSGGEYECVCELHTHRHVTREGSPATCRYRNCQCKYRSAP